MEPITVLAASPGTGLSKAIERLDAEPSICAVDVESYLHGNEVVDWRRFNSPPDEFRNLSTLCAQAARGEVLEYWSNAFSLAYASLSTAAGALKPVLGLHLTLFSSSRLEFYSTPVLRLLQDANAQVSRVVVLIDDIYDAYSRLSAGSNIYEDTDLALAEHKVHASRLTNRLSNDSADATLDVEVQNFTEVESATLQVETTVQNLMRTLHWRRSEMLGAEELARNLPPAKFTVLGVKHEYDALRQLVLDDDLSVVYLSHKITEPRVENLKHEARGHVGFWPRLTTDVNALAPVMREQKVIIVQPTAIDELRFERNLGESVRLERYTGRLAERWPVPDLPVLVSASTDGPRYASLFGGGNTDDGGYRRGLFGLFQHFIYDEIAFRDHLLVSCNDGLLVFRPTAMGAYVSGGVENEIGHWASSLDGRVASRPAAMVHLIDDLYAAIALVRTEDPADTAYNTQVAVRDSLKGVFSEGEGGRIWNLYIKKRRSLVETLPERSGQLARLTLADRISPALDRAVSTLVSTICKVPKSAAHQVAHFTAHTEEQCLDLEMARSLGDFFHEPTQEVFESRDRLLVEALIDRANARDSLDLLRSLAGVQKLRG